MTKMESGTCCKNACKKKIKQAHNERNLHLPVRPTPSPTNNNLPLTKCKTNTKGDIHKLGMGAREYKKHEYVKKDCGNRLLQ